MPYPSAAARGKNAPGAAGAFSVLGLPGLLSWYRDTGHHSDVEMSGGSIADDDIVLAWEDQAGTNHWLVTGVGTATGPRLQTAERNGKDILRFNGTNSCMRCAGLGTLFRGTQAYTIFIACAQDTATGTQAIETHNTSNQDSDYGYTLLRNSGTQKHLRRFADSAAASDAVTQGSDVAIITLVCDGSQVTIKTNNDTGNTVSTGSNGSTINQMTLGALIRPSNANGTFFFDGDVCEIIICNQALSNGVQTQVYEYLGERWGAAPGTPGSLAGTGRYLSNELRWTAATSAVSYTIRRAAAGSGVYSTIATDVTSLYYFDMGLPASTAYDYEVIAVNQFGLAGTAASVATVTTDSGAFTPLKMGTLNSWLKPDALGLSDNTAIQNNTDQSGNGNTFTQGTSNQRPLYKTGIQNGLGMALFDGSNDWFSCDSLSSMFNGNTPFSVFLVVKLTALGNPATDNRNYFIAANITGSATPTIDLYYAPFSNALVHTDRRDSAAVEYSLGFGDPDTNAHVVGIIYDGLRAQLYLDGALMGLATLGAGALAANSLTLGAHRRVDATTAYFNGYIGECCFYPFEVNPTQLGFFNTYIQGRWATPSSIASDPSQFAGLVLWCRSDAINGFQGKNDGDATGSIWYSKTQYLHDLELSGTATYRTGIFGSKPGVLLGSTSAWLEDSAGTIAAHFTAGVPFTMFWTAKASSVAAAISFWSLTQNGASNAFHNARITAAPAYGVGTQNDAGTANTFTGGTADTATHSYIYTYDGRTSTLYVDGAALVTGAQAQADQVFTLIRFAFGGLYRGSLSESWAGHLGEIGAITRVLGPSEIATLVAYQQAYWSTP